MATRKRNNPPRERLSQLIRSASDFSPTQLSALRLYAVRPVVPPLVLAVLLGLIVWAARP